MSEPLLEAHAAVHAWIEEHTYRMIEALVTSRHDDARATFARIAHVLDVHMAFEDAHVLPVYRTVAPADGPGRADHIDGDHVILQRHLAAIADAVAEMSDLRSVLERLPTIYKLIATLEHHTTREQSSMYPAVARVFDDATRQRVLTALLDLVASA
jgi:hypothetical protein